MGQQKREPAGRRSGALAKANQLLDTAPLFDGHNDLPWVIREDATAKGDVAAYGLDRVHQETDTDIPRLKQGKVAAQWWAAYIPSDIDHPGRTVLEQIDIVHQLNERHADVFLAASTAADVAKARRQGKIASFLAIEGTVGLEGSLAPLRVWHAAGARLVTLCHNDTLPWVDSATDKPRSNGLSAFGRELVLELNRLGMVVDCAHVAPSVMRQVLDISRAPVVFSHSCARALCDHPRNVPDDVLDRVAGNGGVVMLTFIPAFLNPARRQWELQYQTPQGTIDHHAIEADLKSGRKAPPPVATIDHVCDHIDYVAKRVGSRHVGIGSDYFGSQWDVPQGLENVSRFPHLIARLIERGWSDANLKALVGGNFLRAFRRVETVGKLLRQSETARIAHA